jgi:class 3 adenylate cyclase/tetratricopeptide (TPR) repeat protein
LIDHAAGEASGPPTLAEAQDAVNRLRRYVPAVVAEGILHDQERLRGQRREITVLFADAVNFTHLSVSLDAEAIFGLINDLLSRLVECVHRYDGMVDKFTGDGLMAVFGAPIAHENDPELAMRAALDMQRAATEFESIAREKLGAPLQIRVGVHCGPAVAGVLGAQQQVAYTVIGETVNLAARLQAMARPGGILASARVFQQTRAFFNFQTAGAIQVKGFDQPIAVYEAIGDRAEPLPTRGIAGVSRIFLGHDGELQQLRDLAAAFFDDGHGRCAIIQGEAGMGKSRLVTEWLSLPMPGPAVIWRGHGLPYTVGIGYAAFRSLMQDALRAYSSGEAWDAHVTPALRPFLRQMLGMSLTADEQIAFRNLEPERIKQLIALAFREWLLGEAHARPVILIIDDFHWADDLSRDLLQSIAQLVDEAPLVLCVMARLQPDKPLRLDGPPTDQVLAAPIRLQIDLKPLSARDSRALLGHLVNLNDLPESIINTILARSEGNPFYIEEFVRVLIEKDVLRPGDGQWRVASAVELQSIEIPTSLSGLMMTRVDRLPQDLQQVLRSAAVLGLQFPTRLLEEVERRLHGTASVQPQVERLIDMGMLEERHEGQDLTYAFSHILAQETIYNSLLHSQRPALHRTAAESVEHLYADNLVDQSEVLMLHYDRARVREKAMRYAVQSGDRARARFANREAIEYYSRALQLSQHLSGYEAARWRAAIGLGEVEQLIGEYEEATAFYQATLEEWRDAGPEDRAWAMLKLAQVWDKRGNLQEAQEWLRQALAQLDRVRGAKPELRAQVYSDLGWLSLRRGDLTAAKEWLEQGLALIRDSEHYGVLSSILNRLGAVYYNHSEWQQAADYVERAIELRERLGDVVGYARSLNNAGILKQASGDWDGALANYWRAVEMHERIGEVEGLAQACTNIGVVYTDRGEWSKAEENLKRSFAIAQRISHPLELAQAHMNLGRLYLLQERWADCAPHLDAAIPLYSEGGAGANLSLSDVYQMQAILHLEQDQLAAARQWATRSFDMLREVTKTDKGESVEWGRFEQLMGRLAMSGGSLSEARQHFDRSIAIFRADGSQLEVGRATYWSAWLSLKLNQVAKAHDELRAAQQIFKQLGAAADLQRIESVNAQIGN